MLADMDRVLRRRPEEAQRCLAEVAQVLTTTAKIIRSCRATADQLTDIRNRAAFVRRVAG